MFANLNYIAIGVSTLVYFIIGALWYSLLFGKEWMKLVGLTPTPEDKKNMPKIFSITFILNFIICLSTAAVIYFVQPVSIIAAIKTAILVSAFVCACGVMNYMYAKRPLKLMLIDMGYHVFGIIIISIILTYWHK